MSEAASLPPSLRREIDALSATMFSLRREVGELKRLQGISEEEMHKRLTWYAALEQLAIRVGAFLADGQEQPLREAYADVREIHKIVSPASRPKLEMVKPA